MKRSEMNQRKILNTEKAIQNAFFHQVALKNWRQISVTDICQDAKISRGTFYLHYQDIPDLNKAIQEGFTQKIVTMFRESFPSTDPSKYRQFIQSLVNYIDDNKNIFDLMNNTYGTGPFDYVKDVMIKEAFDAGKISDNGNSSNYWSVHAAFAVSGIMGIIKGWVLDRYRTPKEQLIDTTVRLLTQISKPEIVS